MKANQKEQQGQGTRIGQRENEEHKGRGSTHRIRKNEDVSLADSAEEPTPRPTPPPNPDMPPNPSRREYEDPGHEHVHKEPTDIRHW